MTCIYISSESAVIQNFNYGMSLQVYKFSVAFVSLPVRIHQLLSACIVKQSAFVYALFLCRVITILMHFANTVKIMPNFDLKVKA